MNLFEQSVLRHYPALLEILFYSLPVPHQSRQADFVMLFAADFLGR